MKLTRYSLAVVLAFAAGILAGRICLIQPVVAAQAPPQLVARPHRFKLKPDQLAEFDRWIDFEHAHHAETVATLDREQMYAESIFRDREHDPTTIYWAELRGVGGASVTTSPLSIDKVYEEFMQRTLIPRSHAVLQPEYTLVPPFLLESIAMHAASERRSR